jgi:hypothetical protein
VKKNLMQHWPLYASILILFVFLALLLATSFYQNQRHLVYALDDAYIHMAMARNFSHYGVWGVTRYAFTSSSSSILWTLLLSLTYYLFGVSQLAPLALNLFFAVLVLGLVHAILTGYKAPPWVKFAAFVAIIFLIPLPALILSGLEQSLQTLLSLLVTFLAARLLSGEAPLHAARDSTLLLALAPLVTAARFEGMFLVLAICGLLLLRKRWIYALGFGLGGFLPVVIYGIISVSHGWFWLPSSVLLKGVMPDLSSPGNLFLSLALNAFVNLHMGLHVFVLVIAVLLFYVLAAGKGCGAFDSRQLMGAIVLLTAIPHLEFVQVSPLFRYDAYLFVLGVVFIAAQLPVILPNLRAPASLHIKPASQYVATGALALLLVFPLTVKGIRLLWFLPQCTTNIFEQQYQMGSFVHQYYQGSTVALNDIGAVNFLADIHCLDLWGLASRDVTALKRAHNYHTVDIAGLSRQAGARIAIVYDYWYGGQVGGLPAEWTRVGQWTIPNNVIAAGETVSFYAPDPSEAPHLIQCLREFSTQLPREVIQSGSYLQ